VVSAIVFKYKYIVIPPRSSSQGRGHNAMLEMRQRRSFAARALVLKVRLNGRAQVDGDGGAGVIGTNI